MSGSKSSVLEINCDPAQVASNLLQIDCQWDLELKSPACSDRVLQATDAGDASKLDLKCM